MDVRLRAAVASTELNVAAFCRAQAISRQTFYVWRRRYLADGIDGLQARSRAPKTNSRRVGADVEDAVVALRKELDELGVDAGPATIGWHLERRGMPAVPSQATIWRILTRRGFVTPQPRKRPVTSWRRFEASCPNELWQADCCDWATLAGPVKIMSFIDDHSRVALAVRAVAAATTHVTWEIFSRACARWGVPLGQLTDNGINFSGKLRGFQVRFEIELRAIGVVPKTSRPYHPQTCGKVERFQQTLKKWLRCRPLAATLAELQAQLDAFVDYYNHHRPHRAIGRITPAERWATTPPAINLGVALPGPALHTTTIVSADGTANAGPILVGVGKAWAGRTARIDYDDHHYAVFIDHQLIRAAAIDPTRRYQGQTGRRNKRRLP